MEGEGAKNFVDLKMGVNMSVTHFTWYSVVLNCLLIYLSIPVNAAPYPLKEDLGASMMMAHCILMGRLPMVKTCVNELALHLLFQSIHKNKKEITIPLYGKC